MATQTSDHEIIFPIPTWLDEKFCWDYFAGYAEFQRRNNRRNLHGNHENYYYKGVSDGKTALVQWGWSHWIAGFRGLEKRVRIESVDEICTSSFVFREYQYGHYAIGAEWKEYFGYDEASKPPKRTVYKNEGDGVCWLKAPGLWFSENSKHLIALTTEYYVNSGWSDSH